MQFEIVCKIFEHKLYVSVYITAVWVYVYTVTAAT